MSSLPEKLNQLDEIIAKMNYVLFYQIYKSENYNAKVDAIKKIRDILHQLGAEEYKIILLDHRINKLRYVSYGTDWKASDLNDITKAIEQIREILEQLGAETEKLQKLDQIIAKHRTLKYGDVWQTRDINDRIDAIKQIREILAQMIVPPEQIKNGGFETGDFTDWELAGDYMEVTDIDAHSGTYSARLILMMFPCEIRQTLDVPIPVSNVDTFELYARTETWEEPCLEVEIGYTDGTNTIEDFTVPPRWTRINLKPYLEYNKKISYVAFRSICFYQFIFLDDISLKGRP
ncbi:MAG: hypothetical protein DRJ03_12210 [Chloroflexi bacterium]|nr:MAG: hypothetical protein DRJ03_12165 [Chloroflexota bacterium]RLC85263.1 MAG: hypothetical protein DRJ03_12210 [Chloroflexota bacterium]